MWGPIQFHPTCNVRFFLKCASARSPRSLLDQPLRLYFVFICMWLQWPQPRTQYPIFTLCLRCLWYTNWIGPKCDTRRHTVLGDLTDIPSGRKRLTYQWAQSQRKCSERWWIRTVTKEGLSSPVRGFLGFANWWKYTWGPHFQ